MPRRRLCAGVNVVASDTTRPQDGPEPWRRQPGDTRASFHAFMHYRDLPAWSRSIDAAYHEHRRECLQIDDKQDDSKTEAEDTRRRAPMQWMLWSGKHNWVERSARYDEYRAEERRLKRVQQLDDAQDEIVSVANLAMARVVQRLRLMTADELPSQVIDRWIKTLAEVKLRALGHEERLAVEHTGKDGGPIEIAESIDMAALLANPATRKALETLGIALEESNDDAE